MRHDPDYIPWPFGLIVFFVMLAIPLTVLYAISGWLGPCLFLGLLALLYVVAFGSLAVSNIKRGRRWSHGMRK